MILMMLCCLLGGSASEFEVVKGCWRTGICAVAEDSHCFNYIQPKLFMARPIAS